MGMTITEKIMARHSGRTKVQPGENIWCNIDILMTHDVCGPGTIGVFEKEFGKDAKVFDPEKIIIIPDHYIFTADPKAHRNIAILRDFCKRQGIKYFYDPDFIDTDAAGIPAPYADPAKTSYRGVCHSALPQNGHVRPGEILLGTDSHTCTHGAFGQMATGVGNTDAGFVMGTGKLWLTVPSTMKFVFDGELPPYIMAKDIILHVIGEIGFDGATYKAMEFAGDAITSLNVEERCTICNMAIEAGGKSGIIAPDAVTMKYVDARNTGTPYEPVYGDKDAGYECVMNFDASALQPTVAQPHCPDRRALAADLKDVKIQRSYIGSCTGGKTVDFCAAATVLAGRKVAVDTFIVPATTEVDMDLDRKKVGGRTLREIFIAAGCKIAPASCAACLGGPVDTFGHVHEPINVVSTTNRNFPGRMGHKSAGIFLASPLTAAASAITGHITDPREFCSLTRPIGLAE
ncbi:MAG TPA: aconitase/3-isopropylmalate dehydratase large subunit family protein [Phycisphaerae bacterium]|nr:aconitase/3-isopropylmalate dehydratase large subunit family protein [Phycisphaerae bacterium]HPS52716.1 aconitase/3-isopropylmalate dehydratase large subunit family protein [Phycisphaerae bacterium]